LDSEIRPAMTGAYFIAGRFLLVNALDPWSAELARKFFRDFHLQPTTGSTVRSAGMYLADGEQPHASYVIRIRSDVAVPAIPAGLESFEVAFGHCHVDQATYYLSIEDSLIVVAPDGGQLVDVWIGSSSHARRSLSLVNVLSYALEAALRRSGLYQLHGAGVLPPNESTAALFLGESGSGKSTLASLLAVRGWRYLTDDALLLAQDGKGVIARGIRRFFAASETTLKASALTDMTDALGPPMASDPSKRRLEPETAFPERFIESCKPGVLCFIGITGEAKSRVSSLSARDAMTRLIRTNPWASYDTFTASEHLKLLNRLVNQCRAYAFDSGLDILREPACVEALIAPLWADN
jgi:hypothetical protein